MDQNFYTALRRQLALFFLILCGTLLTVTGCAFAQSAPESIKTTIATVQSLSKDGQPAAAAALGESWLSRHANDPELDGEDGAFLLYVIADAFGAGMQYEKALQLQLRAFGIQEKVFGSDHLYTATSLVLLASTYVTLTQYEMALPLQLRALVISEKVLGPEHAEIATSLQRLAAIYIKLSRYESALPPQLRALKIHEKGFGPEHLTTVDSLNKLANTYSHLGQYAKALPLQLRALAIREKVLGPKHTDTATSLHNIAVTYHELGQYDKAVPLQQRVAWISETSLGPDHPETAKALSNLAVSYSSLAQYEKALPLHLRALAIYDKTLGPDHPSTARVLNNLGQTYSEIAQYDKALPIQLRALTIHEKTLGSDHLDVALYLDNLGLTYSALAQYEKALPLHLRALAIGEETLSPDHPDIARSLNNLALAYVGTAQHDIALPLELRALAIREKVLGPMHTNTATSLSNLAVIYQELAQYDKALELQLRSLDICAKSLGPEHPKTATILSNLASTYTELAQNDKALALRKRALLITEKALGPAHPDIADKLDRLAFNFFTLGQTTVALSLYKMAVNAYQTQRERVAEIGSSELLRYTQSISGTYRSLAWLLSEQGRLAEAQRVLEMLKEEEYFDFIRRSSVNDPRTSRIGYNATERVWVNRYRQIADQLAALGAESIALKKQAEAGLTPQQKKRQKAVATDLKVSQKAFESFLNQMQVGLERQKVVRAVETEELSQTAMRAEQELIKSLGSDVVLLRYYVTDDAVGILMTTAGVQLAHSVAIKAKDLNRQVMAFRSMLLDQKSDPVVAAQALYALLIAPVAAALETAGAKTIMLSLDGALRYLPFGALHDGQRYLVHRWNLPMFTSVTKNRLRDVVPPQWQVAGFGVTRPWRNFAGLPAVRNELINVVKAGSGKEISGNVYLDADFTAQRFKDASASAFQLVHVASHFQFSAGGTEANSFLLLGDGQELTLADIRTQNYRFDNVDLLTLAACDTGLGGGRDANGREIEGFGVIAQQQGAKAVLATLWSVADKSTSTLMADMYRQRQENKLTKIEALRRAQIAVLENPRYQHPFYWAPFILMGNWK